MASASQHHVLLVASNPTKLPVHDDGIAPATWRRTSNHCNEGGIVLYSICCSAFIKIKSFPPNALFVRRLTSLFESCELAVLEECHASHALTQRDTICSRVMWFEITHRDGLDDNWAVHASALAHDWMSMVSMTIVCMHACKSIFCDGFWASEVFFTYRLLHAIEHAREK